MALNEGSSPTHPCTPFFADGDQMERRSCLPQRAMHRSMTSLWCPHREGIQSCLCQPKTGRAIRWHLVSRWTQGRFLSWGASILRALRIFDLDRRESSMIPGSDGLYSPRWSPDGRYIAALTSGDVMVKVFDMTTQNWSSLLENMGHWGFPDMVARRQIPLRPAWSSRRARSLPRPGFGGQAGPSDRSDRHFIRPGVSASGWDWTRTTRRSCFGTMERVISTL